MSQIDPVKQPRLYIENDLQAGNIFPLAPTQGHYLRNVLRRASGDPVRLFNGRDGEWLATLDMPDKKTVLARPAQSLRPQPAPPVETHLLFSPLKKDALDFLIEKAVELGVTHLHPVLTQNTESRRMNEDRVNQQIIEAVEQCERLSLPKCLNLMNLDDKLASWHAEIEIYAAFERENAQILPKVTGPAAFLIGPEGGFTVSEREKIGKYLFVKPVSLGNAILRAETAALFCLSARLLNGQ